MYHKKIYTKGWSSIQRGGKPTEKKTKRALYKPVCVLVPSYAVEPRRQLRFTEKTEHGVLARVVLASGSSRRKAE